MKLMIVDDSNIMRKAIQKYLEPFNLKLVGTASDGASALELFKQTLPDIVTLDVTMPNMDGLTCLDNIMKIKPNTLVIIITALDDPETGLLAAKKGAKGFIGKPFTEKDLVDEIVHILEEYYD